jgi:ABC-2 type transport system ATP-binding protein
MKGRDVDGHFLLDLLSRERIVPLKFAVMEPALESLFMEVVR